MILSSSRDKTCILWELKRTEEEYGFARRALTGHSHFVEDVVISSDGQFALSCSWDRSLRLWDLNSVRSGVDGLFRMQCNVTTGSCARVWGESLSRST